jgi:hypothetical protein
MKSDFIDPTKNRKIIFPFIILFTFFALHQVIEHALDAALVSPVLSEVKATWYLDLAFFAAALYLLILNIYKIWIRTYSSTNTLAYWFLLLFVYYWYRIPQEPWTFLSLDLTDRVKYLDVLPFLAISNIMLIITSAFLKRSPHYGFGFIEDSPIVNATDDQLSYALYASQLALKLNQSSFKKSFAVGITGEWGTGKTSFINLVKENLDQSKFIVIDFNAWDSHSPKAIIRDFFTTLKSGLSKYHSDISSLLLNYSDSLIKSYDPLFSNLLHPITSDLKSKSIFEQRSNIEKATPKIAKQIVFCIDELDRLDKEELIEVIKLIRNTANFPKVIFLVSYDRSYLIEAIRKLNKQNSESFLEKIFQLEITLPYFDIKSLQNIISIKIEASIGSSFKEEIKKVVFSQYFSNPPEYSDYITTIRDVTRLVNSLSFHFDLLKNEVSFHDLFYLEILRIKYPAVYELLWRKYDTFLQQSDGLDINQTFKLKTSSPTGYVISNYIRENHQSLSVRKSHLEKIDKLFQILFSDKTTLLTEDNRLSIKYPSNFFMYFAYRLLPGNLSEEEFKRARKGDQKAFNTYVENAVKNELHFALIRRLKQIHFESKTDFEKIINGIFHLQKQEVKSKTWNGPLVGYDGSDLANKLSNSHHRLDKLYNGSQKEVNKFIIRKFNEAKSPYLTEAFIIKDMLGVMVDDEYVINKSELFEILLGYLESYLAKISSLDTNAWFLYQDCEVKVFVADSSGGYVSQKKVVSGANDVFISFIKEKDIYGFLNSLISPSPHDRYESEYKNFAIWDIALRIFGSWDEFYRFLISVNSSDKDYVAEFLLFFNKFKDSSFSNYVPFEFNHFKKIPENSDTSEVA